jgi:hypothetical protein
LGVVYNDDTTDYSSYAFHYFNPFRLIKAPTNVKASFVIDDDTYHVKLQWDGKQPDNLSLKGYHIYSNGGVLDDVALVNSIGIITYNHYKYEIDDRGGNEYKFAVAAVAADGHRSTLSEVVSIQIPTLSVPNVIIWPIDQKKNIIMLQWNYSEDIFDLAGFRLYENDVLIADEKMLNKDARSWTSGALPKGDYAYVIEAVTKSNIRSRKSQPRRFKID